MNARSINVRGIVDLHWDNAKVEWVLDAPIHVRWDTGKWVFSFVVPAGFRTDLSSIPPRLRSIIPQVGRHNRASIPHDWAYEDGVPDMTRREADLMHLDIMELDGVVPLRRWVIFLGTRLGGRRLWGKGEPS